MISLMLREHMSMGMQFLIRIVICLKLQIQEARQQLDKNRRVRYFFVSYVYCIIGFQELIKVIFVDGTVLGSKCGGVLLSAEAQDAENHIFRVYFYVVDKECDASYEYFFENMRIFIDDTDELCIIFDSHSSIRKMVPRIYPASHYGCCMRHFGQNI